MLVSVSGWSAPSFVSKDSYGWMPLSLAAKNGREAIIRLLLDTGSEVDSKDY
jgi:ankyrin repeat protein